MYNIEQRDIELQNASSNIVYYLSFPKAAQHIVNIKLELLNPHETEIFAIVNWIPGSYKIRDFVTNQGNLKVLNENSEPLEYEWLNKNRLKVLSNNSKKIVLEYIYWGNERTVRHSHINRFHAFINPANCLMLVESREQEIHLVKIENPWERITTALTQVNENTFAAKNYDILIDSPMEIGNHEVYEYTISGAKHEVAIYGKGSFDAKWISQQTEKIVECGLKMWGSLPYDRYVFFIQLLPNLRGGLEHSRSSVNMFDSNTIGETKAMNQLLALLVHEYFHLWNVKRIRPYNLGKFDYYNEVYTDMLWLCEGVTSYYDDILTYLCGFRDTNEFLSVISEDHITKLLATPGREQMSVKESSFHTWAKFYNPNPDSINRYPSYYTKGGTIAWLLDIFILKDSNNAKNLDNIMLALMERYNANNEIGINEHEFYAIAHSSTNIDIKPILEHWLNGTDELPINEYLEYIGLEYSQIEKKNIFIGENIQFQNLEQEFDFGFELKDIEGKLVAEKVHENSEAENAGIGSGDEIISFNNVRVTNINEFHSATTNATNHANMLCASEGQIYSTEIKIIPKVKYGLKMRDNISSEQRINFNKWLRK